MAEIETASAETLERERALFQKFQQDPQVIGEVYDVYADRLYGFLLKRCGHRETAEDLVSRTFMKLLESRRTLVWQGYSLGAWLFRVASNALTDHWRSASTRLDDALNEEEWNPPSTDDPAWNAEVALEGDRIRELLQNLSSRDQEVLQLRFYGGYDIPEIASVLGIDANHASVLVYRALGRLRKAYLLRLHV